MPRKICVQWPRLGPYHIARLRAAEKACRREGLELIALETAGDDSKYAWRREASSRDFRREQLFPNQTFETLRPRVTHAAVIRRLDMLQPDAVAITSYSFPDARACLTWCRNNRRVAVLMTASRYEDAPRVRWREAVKRRLVHLYDAALVGGTPQRTYLSMLGFPLEKVFEPYNAVDNAFFREAAERARADRHRYEALPGLGDRSPFFLTSSRFLPIKNLDGLLRAYASYRARSGAPWRLVLLGDGPERGALERQIEDHRIQGVTFAGFRQIEELPAYYGLAGAFVHSSLKDPWGLVVNEAMATGLPVLVSRQSGCAIDLVEEGKNGFTFDGTSQQKLTALLELVGSEEFDRRAAGKRSQELVDAWSPERFADGLLAAVRAGTETAARGLSPADRLLLAAIGTASRRATAFHTVRDL